MSRKILLMIEMNNRLIARYINYCKRPKWIWIKPLQLTMQNYLIQELVAGFSDFFWAYPGDLASIYFTGQIVCSAEELMKGSLLSTKSILTEPLTHFYIILVLNPSCAQTSRNTTQDGFTL